MKCNVRTDLIDWKRREQGNRTSDKLKYIKGYFDEEQNILIGPTRI